MKFIATNPFPNPPGKPIVIKDITGTDGKVEVKQSHIKLDGVEQTTHIHKGAVFNYGTASEFKDLAPAEKTLVAHLVTSQKIVEATPANVERVNKEVAQEKLIAERDAKRDANADPMAVLAKVLSGLQEAVEAVSAGQAQIAAALAPKK